MHAPELRSCDGQCDQRQASVLRASQTWGRARSRRSFVWYSLPSSTHSTPRIYMQRRVTETPPSPTNNWFRGGTSESPFSIRPLVPKVRSGTPKLSRCSPTRESISGRLNYDRDAKCFINQQTGFFNIYITLHTATCTPASRSAKSHALCWSLSRSFVLFTSTTFTCSSEADRHRMRSGAPQLQPL